MAKQAKKQVQTKSTRALYIRVSTEAQAEEGFSIGAQTERLIGYCTSKGWNDYELYIDGGFSGSNLNRTEMQRMIEDVQRKKLKSILVYKLDRLSRSQKDTLYLIEDVFIPNDVDFISLNENIDTSSPYGRAMIGILSAFAQLERENIYMRTRMGMLERVKKGYWMGGGRTPYGYDYDTDLGMLIPNADANNVRKMYELYIKGYSGQKLATLFGLTSDNVVMNILNRRSNLGIIPYNGEEYEGKHDAIIDEETYQLAQHKMQERSQRARATQKSVHLLSGLIYCGHCGARMRYIRWGKTGFKLRCYSLEPSKTYMHRDEDCSSEAVWAHEIEEIVLKDMFKLSAKMDPSDRDQYMGYADPMVELKSRILNIENKLRRLYNLYAEDENEILLSSIAASKKELERVKAELAMEEESQITSHRLDKVRERVATIADTWDCLSDMEKQVLIRDCVDRIVITRNRVEIFYTFKNEEEVEESVKRVC